MADYTFRKDIELEIDWLKQYTMSLNLVSNIIKDKTEDISFKVELKAHDKSELKFLSQYLSGEAYRIFEEIKDGRVNTFLIPFINRLRDGLTLRVDSNGLIHREIELVKGYLLGRIAVLKNIPGAWSHENSVEIKFPTLSIADFQIYLKEYRNVFEPLIVDPELGGKMEMVSSRHGSIILEFITNSADAVALIGSVSYAAAYILKQRKDLQLLDEKLTSFKLSNELKKASLDAAKEEIENMIEVESIAVESKHLKKTKNERLAQIRTSIKLLVDLFQKGGEVLPGPGVDTNTTNSFPDLKQIENLRSQVKKLSGGKGK